MTKTSKKMTKKQHKTRYIFCNLLIVFVQCFKNYKKNHNALNPSCSY